MMMNSVTHQPRTFCNASGRMQHVHRLDGDKHKDAGGTQEEEEEEEEAEAR